MQIESDPVVIPHLLADNLRQQYNIDTDKNGRTTHRTSSKQHSAVGRRRNLIEGSTPKKQITKTIEEIGEVAAGLVRSNHLEVRDGIGDVFVTYDRICQMDTDYTHSFERRDDPRSRI